MVAQIRPNRLDVNDRFPMLGFTIRTDGAPQRAEVAIATEPGLLAAQGKPRRTNANFYSSRAGGALSIPRGEAVYVVPPEVLARFVGAERLYFGLATAPAGNGAAYQVAAMPTESSPYISLINLTDRALRRVRLMPNRQQRAAGYGEAGQTALEWAGDAAAPGAEPAKAANGANGMAPAPTNGAPTSAAPYDDGFGPLPAANTSVPGASVPPPPANGAQNGGAPAAASSYYGRAMDAGGVHNVDIQTSGDPVAVTPPPIFTLDGWKRELLIGAVEVLTGPVGAFIAGLRSSAKLFGVSIGFGPAVGAGFMSGAGLGVGLIFGPNGELGAYGSVELDVGFISSLSATLQVTVVKGGIEAFNGWSNAVAISGGEEIVGGASILFNEKHEFCGVTVQAGVGAGLSPVDIYVSAQQSRAVQVMSMALAYGRTGRDSFNYRGARRPAPVWSKSLAARTLGDDPLAVDIKYRMFIPSPLIDSPLEVYGGDGRGFSYAGGTSRGEIHATVRLTPGGGIAGIDIIDRNWGESTGYATSDSYHPEGKPDWWLEKVEGAQPTERKTLQVSDDNLNITVGASTRRSIQTAIEGSSVVTITAAGALPLSMTAPDIDATMSVFLRVNGNDVEAKVDGSHDGFPCHELYVNGKRLYGYDPVAAGNGPTNLLPPEDIEATTNWVTVATIGATSQGLAARSQPARAMAGDAWSINWDDVEMIPQPTDMGCWATAAAMVIGWRDHKSVDPRALATNCPLPTNAMDNGIGAEDFKTLAQSLGLVSELPACYTPEGFRGLLERYGPLWIAALTPDKHIRVVTGMYSDGLNNYVRITDPIDREVGTPGSPGAPKGTHTTGTRYIMTYEALAAEYEAAGMIVPAGTMQILHCTAADVALRQPNRTDGTTAGYAQSLGRFEPSRPVRIGRQARAMDADNESFSINWDDVELIAQPTDMGCWATSAAMVVGWRDRQSVDPRSLAKSCPIPETAMDDGVTPKQFEELANSVGLIAEPAACYTPEGFRQILERSGPLWVAGISPGRHIRVVTGMYNDGSNIYVRITDPWDRVVGTPGAPGPIPSTHNTGSRYIMTYDAFAAEYEAAGAVVPAGTMQILHARPEDISDRSPNRVDGKSSGYAQGLAARTLGAPMLASLQFSATAWPASAPETLTRECDEVLPEDQKVAYWKGLLDSLVGPQTAAKLRDLPAVAKDRGWTVVVGAGATPGVALVSAIGSGLVIDPSSQPYTFGIGRLDGGDPPDPFEPKNMAAVIDGKPQITIVEGDTRTLMRFGLTCAFRTQDKRVRNGAAILDPAGNFVGATFQLEVNGLKAEDIVDAVKVGYAQTPAKYGMFSKPLGLAQGRGRSTVRGFADEPPVGTTATRVQKDQAGVKFDLAQLSGLVQPQTVPMVAINTPMPGRRVVLNDWPYLDGPGGRTHGDVSIDWAYAAGSVGNIVTDVAGAAAFDGTALTVTTNIWPVTSVVDPMVAAVCICARFVFSRAGQPDQVAVTEVTVFGDGRDPQRVNRQEQAAPTTPASPIGAY